MSSSSKLLIKQAIQGLSKGENSFSVLGTVEEIDLVALTCNVAQLLEAPDLFNVSLFPLDDKGTAKKGFLQIPKVGSVVVVSFINGKDNGYVSMFSEVDFIHLNGSSYGGLIQIEKLVEKINNLENKLNSLISVFNAHTHPYVNVATPAVTSITATLVTPPLTPTQKAELENTTVLHGNAQ